MWTVKEIESALSVKISNKIGKCQSVHFDSRCINDGDLFVALIHDCSRNGHDFVVDALSRGASAAIVSSIISGVDQCRLIVVDNTFYALKALALYKRAHSNAKFIAVTGSVGKTSTKEMLKLMLNCYGRTFASYGNFNNYLGVHLTLASLPNDVEYVVIEMGMSLSGELRILSDSVNPHIVVITDVSDAHFKAFNSIKDIADAKCEILSGITSNGVMIINRDISTYNYCMSITRAFVRNIITFGIDSNAFVRLLSYKILNKGCVSLEYLLGNRKLKVLMLSVIPIHLARNLAAALAVTVALKLDARRVIDVISSFQLPLGRCNLELVNSGNKQYRVICDYYNASPQSMKSALEFLRQFNNNHKVAILGDMLDLGNKSLQLHIDLVFYINVSGVNDLFLLGNIITRLDLSLFKGINVYYFYKVEHLISGIDNFIENNSLILIKGSRDLKLEVVAQHLGVVDVL